MRNLVALVLISVLFAACESSEVEAPSVADAAFAKKPSKKCASCGLVAFMDANGVVLLLDETTAPIDTVSTLELDGVSMARSGDALYLMRADAYFYVFDLKDPAHPVEVAQIKLRDLPNSP